jgi:hypothetical protein
MKAWLALWSAAQLRGMDNRGPTGNDGRGLSPASSGAWRSCDVGALKRPSLLSSLLRSPVSCPRSGMGAARRGAEHFALPSDFTCLLSFVAIVLFEARRWGRIETCRTVGELETCRGQASPRQVLGMLAWHAANVVPVLDIPHSLEWHRPARPADAVVGASILALRLWVAIGILAVLKRLWDKRGPGGPGPTVSYSGPPC